MKFVTSLSLSSLQSLKQLSSSTSKWNSKTNVIITHPLLLIMENCKNMLQLKQIQAHMTRTGIISHTFPASRVLAFCALSNDGDIRHAYALFTQIQQRNTYIWNTMIRGYCKVKDYAMGFLFFRQMVRECVQMDTRSFVFGLKACEGLGGVCVGKSLHCVIWKMGFDSELLVQNGLVHFYGEVGWLAFARKVFDEIPSRDVVSWTSMIDGYARCNRCDEAVELFDVMLSSDVVPNEVTVVAVLSACARKGDLQLGKSVHEYVRNRGVAYSLNLQNALLDMYVKCGCLRSATAVFKNMKTKDVFSWTAMVNGYAKCGELDFAIKLFNEMPERNVVSWNVLIAGYSQNDLPQEALRLFHEMMEVGLAPTENTLVCVLSACGQLGCLHLGQWIHLHFIAQKRIQLNVILGNALIDMYAKCGAIKAASELFKLLPARDLVSWNSIIMGYATHGHATGALLLFEQMKGEGYKPDDITFVGILSACSHGGLVKEGQKYFESMKYDFHLEPKGEHYGCMVDLFGRQGLLQEAYRLIMEMPMEPDEAAWGALLNACKIQGNMELAKLAAHNLITLDPDDSGIYVLLANICAHERSWDDVKMVRSLMRERGVKKNPGHSSIEVEGRFHRFLVGDETHPRSKEIYRMLTEINLLSRLEDGSELMDFNVHYEDVLLDFAPTSPGQSSVSTVQYVEI